MGEARLTTAKKEREAYIAEVRSEPITQKQKAKLLWFGYPVRDEMTKGEASDAIDECIRKNPEKEREYYERPATEEQMTQLSARQKHLTLLRRQFVLPTLLIQSPLPGEHWSGSST